MEVLFHARHCDVDITAAFHERKQPAVQVFRVAPEVVVGIHAHHCVKLLPFERKRLRVGFDGNYPLSVKSHGIEESAVFGGVAPEVGGVDGEAVFPGEENARQSLTAPKVAYYAA